MATIVDILATKRDGLELSDASIAQFIAGIGDGLVSDPQIAALTMAIVINGMTAGETTALTLAMRASGEQLRWPDLAGPVLDKHSSGGIGDKVSLILAPLLASLGAFVPMISGRGLGHTGGTLDKLESLNGLRTDVDLLTLQNCLKSAGCAIVGANVGLAPADRALYAIRDVTATVKSLPLITASILSKKLAGGAEALLMDVKVGSGAFCPTLKDAQDLARSIVTVANAAGLPTRAMISDMTQCLGHNAGNALEVEEALAMLTNGQGDARLKALVLEQAVELLVLGGLYDQSSEALAAASQALDAGAAFERFERMAFELGAVALNLPEVAPVVRDVPSPRCANVARIDAKAIGHAIIELGGGRLQPGQSIDHRVGFSELIGIGAISDRPLARVHARSEADAEEAIARLQQAYMLTEARVEPPILIHERMKA